MKDVKVFIVFVFPANDDTAPAPQLNILTEEQRRVLLSLSDDTIYTFLKQIEQTRGDVVKRNKKRLDVSQYRATSVALRSAL